MSISPEEASKSLQQVDRVAAVTRTAAAYAGADLIFGVWGVAWTAGFLASHALERARMCALIGPLWLVVVLAALGATFWLARRHQEPVRNPEGGRIGVFWFALYLYFGIIMFLGTPFVDTAALNSLRGVKFITTLQCLIPMFAYIVMGLWLHQNYFIGFALFMTAIVVIGFVVFSAIFWIWMAVFGGGMFLAMAIYMRISWRRAVRQEQQKGMEDA
jgi:hypothetical protein